MNDDQNPGSQDGNPFGGPIRIPVKAYHGKDSAKRFRFQAEIEQANKIEEYLNAKYVKGQPQTIEYGTIARDTYLERETVARLLFPVCGGSNGITF